MRTFTGFVPLLLFVLGSACDQGVTVLVQYGCDTEDIVIESWAGATATEVARFAPGSAPVCFLVAESKVPTLRSRCASSPVPVPVQIGVFDPVQECNR
jgi:hypothetical protein